MKSPSELIWSSLKMGTVDSGRVRAERLTLLLTSVPTIKIQVKSQFDFAKYLSGESTAEEVSFEWSHQRISPTDSKDTSTLNVSVTDSGSERFKHSL